MHNSYYWFTPEVGQTQAVAQHCLPRLFQPFSQSGIIKNIKFKVQNVHLTSSRPRVCHLG